MSGCGKLNVVARKWRSWRHDRSNLLIFIDRRLLRHSSLGEEFLATT